MTVTAAPTTASGTGLRLERVSYRYAGAPAPTLRQIDLRLDPGRVTGVVGANESGKSTLCLVAAGIAPAVVGGHVEGSVTLDGVASTALRPHELALRCGVLFQNPSTQLSNTTSTVFEEIAFGPRNLGLPLADVVDRVWWALRAVGVEDLAPRDPTRLSGGQAQLVALASVLALRPAYLILDEPTSQLDPAGTALVADALVRVARETGSGILLVEHKTAVLARIADHVVALDGGTVALAGSARDVLADPRLTDLGVEPPPEVRLRRAARGLGLDERVLAGAFE